MAEAQPKQETGEKENFVDELKPGTKLMHGQYTIESFLNAGGFGITYLARDSLDRKVVIKECFPGAFCRRSRFVVQARSRAHQNELKSIVRLFVQEARSLAKLDHPNIVGVHQVFEDNDTAYMALDFVEGRDLLDIIEDPNHTLPAATVKTILKEVLGAVGFIHDQGILHRDISPDNILINKNNHPVLIDFGAAREEATKQSRVLSALRVVKDGYSPQEFYIAGSEQSPSSDLYALAASFHHLIADDVPPNSQARLAAIASGESDPYQPLAGRFSDYDDKFLTALDKALAVLPKDRVQSAKEWIEMMDGEQGNVTPLNAAATAAPATAAPAAAAAKKSNMPMLLGTAAVIALLVGVGAFVMTGGSDETATATAPTPAPAPVEAPTETAEATTPAVTDTSTLFTSPSTPATEPEVADTVAAAPAEEPEVADTVTPAPVEEPEVAEVVTPAPVETEEPATAAEPEETTDLAAAPVETPEPAPAPEIVEEPEVAAVEAPAVVEVPTAAETPTPTLRPEARPPSIAAAALPAPQPLPEPVVTPDVASAEPAETADLTNPATDAPAVDTQVAAVSLPATPDSVAEIGTGPEVDIAAVTPGNEIVLEVTPPAIAEAADDGISQIWTVQLPFTAAGERSNIIAEVGPVAPVWVKPGLVITGINGVPVDAIADIQDVVRTQIREDELESTLPVLFETLDPASGERASAAWVLPVVQQLTLTDGTQFETVFGGSGWRTTVADLPADAGGGLQVGDVLTSYIPTGEDIDDRTTLRNILSREAEAGTTQYMFAVQRDGSLWVASLEYESAAQ
ncbi:MAG: protein kinase [Pseudomonadota bacterium]